MIFKGHFQKLLFALIFGMVNLNVQATQTSISGTTTSTLAISRIFSSTPSANDAMGQISFIANVSASDLTYALITGLIDDATTSHGYGHLSLATLINGQLTKLLDLNSSGLSLSQGNIVTSSGAVKVNGSGGGFVLGDRVNPSHSWTWYSSGDTANLNYNSNIPSVSVTSSGNVGIGSLSPTSKLVVVGNGIIDGNLATTGTLTAGGAIGAESGSASAPGIAFSSDTNTGLYNPSSDKLALVTNGTARLTLDNSGNVGIKTTTPSQPLEVNGVAKVDASDFILGSAGSILRQQTIGASSDWTFLNSGAGTANVYAGGLFLSNSYTAAPPTNGAYIQGNVGIGNSSPAVKLELTGSTSTFEGIRLSEVGFPTYNWGITYYNFNSKLRISPSSTALTNSGSINLMANGGSVAIGADYPDATFQVVGNAHVNNDLKVGGGLVFTTPLNSINTSGHNKYSYSANGAIYLAYDNDTSAALFAMDGFATAATRLTSHADPSTIAPGATTSFHDPQVAMPFSFKHENQLLGKGEIVDMSKIVDYIQHKMQAELGDAAGKVTFDYDLPTSECLTMSQLNQARVQATVDIITQKLNQMPLIKMNLGEGGAIPPEAVEDIDEIVPVSTTKIIKENVPDLNNMRIIVVEKEVTQTILTPTGKKIKKFKDGYDFRDGDLYRRPTINDVDVAKLIMESGIPQGSSIPSWVSERLKDGAQQGQTLSQSMQRIRETLLSQSSKPSGATTQTAAPSPN